MVPPALVLGCNTPHGINVLSDWIEEQTGYAPDFNVLKHSAGYHYIYAYIYGVKCPESYTFMRHMGCGFVGNGDGNGVGDGFSYGYDGDGNGCGIGMGDGYGQGCGDGWYYGDRYGDGDGN